MIIRKGILHSSVHDEWLSSWAGLYTYANETADFTGWEDDYHSAEWTDDCIVIIPGELL